MFVRARPKIDREKLHALIDTQSGSIPDELLTDRNKFFFNSGRSSLKWYLTYLKNKQNKSLVVGLQAFTCSVVTQAVLESGNKPYYFDVDKKYFTTLIGQIDFNKIDILILSHLYGIPNPDYLLIKEKCKELDIGIIDDLSQTLFSRIDHHCLEELSDCYFYSFGFDKPVSTMNGGMIFIRNDDLELQESYHSIKPESFNKEKSDLVRLLLYHEITSSMNYTQERRLNDRVDALIVYLARRKIIPMNAAMALLKLAGTKPLLIFRKIFNSWVHRIFSIKINVQRMGYLKRTYFQHVYPQFQKDKKFYYEIKEKTVSFFKKMFKDIQIPDYVTGNIEPSWYLRFPVLAKDPKTVIELLSDNGIEAGPYNWDRLSFEGFRELQHLNKDNYINSKQLTCEIINIPNWDDNIWKRLSNIN
ncbi:MAG: DegT/DnrJ/EryC1/StrS family aminotransferase [Candidatus Marinimicrobia bacterium]|nr:DegT/DnrJ/EryC1/StrS family aminotransferase [Candidatus Neomarinimicrobiota bacterium]